MSEYFSGSLQNELETNRTTGISLWKGGELLLTEIDLFVLRNVHA